MSKPAAVNLKIAKKLGKAIPPGSTFAAVDWDKADEYLTGQHNPDDVSLAEATSIALRERQEYLEEGRDAKARKAQAAINAYDNARVAVRSSWCPTCLNFLHNCQCPAEVEPVSISFIDKITARIPNYKEEAKARKKEQARQSRKARKLGLV